MEDRKKIYIVSFGDSRKYKVEFTDESRDPYRRANPLDGIEQELRDFLNKEFPDEPVAYYVTPKVTEIVAGGDVDPSDYPRLDAYAIEQIKASLRRDMQVMEDNKKLDANALYADINNG